LTGIVVDSSVVIPWFLAEHDPAASRGRRVLHRYRRGEIALAAPPLLPLEVINVAATRRRFGAAALGRLSVALGQLRIELASPSLDVVAEWCARGLTAYDAAYVALAAERSATLLTFDSEILRVAHGVAESPG
jgi:predicted nucleic acid-binding protein